MVMGNYERINLRKYLGLAAVAALILSLTACSTANEPTAGDPDSLTGTELTVYSGRSEIFISSFFADFEAQTGIKLNVRYGDSAELAAQLLEEGKNSKADIFISQDAGSLGAVAETGMLAALDNTVLDLVEPQYRAADLSWVGLTARARVFAYDPIKVTQLPTSIDDLLDPKWSGKIGIAPTNSSFQAFVTALRQLRGEAAAEAWLKGLAANKPISFEKNSMIVEAIDAGQIELGLVNHYYIYEVAKALGRDINVNNGFFKAGDAGNLINVSGAGVLATAKNSAGAAELIKFLLSGASQNRFVADTKEYAILSTVNPPADLPTLVGIGSPSVDLTALKDVAATQQLLVRVGLL
jgi:iron(III) transport system substrate-binding protein